MHTPESVAWDVIPSTEALLRHPAISRLCLEPGILTGLVRSAIQALRSNPPTSRAAGIDAVVASVSKAAAAYRLPRRRYVNATGIIIHTQWGNAPLTDAAEESLVNAGGSSPTGAREFGERTVACERMLVALTGAEAATVTTQNAASCLLVATALAHRRDMICAARDLIEISHGVRLRNILESGGANVLPVGSANCVYLDDYRCAVDLDTVAIVRIYAANTVTTGYTAHVDTAALVQLAHAARLPLIVNLGSGSLVDLRERGLPPAPTIREELRCGADLVLASGDKLIGGPQAGIIVGRRELVERLTRHPIARCCRPGKLTLAALEATLASYVAGRAWDEVPVLRLLAASEDELRERAQVIDQQARQMGLTADVVPDATECGGATLPGVKVPTWTVRFAHPSISCDDLHSALLQRRVVARRRDDFVVLDLRSVLPEDDSELVAAIKDSAQSVADGAVAQRAP